MFDSIAALVVRRGWLVLAVWLALTGLLYLIAPEWESVSRDDDVRFFPPGYPSVVGQDLLERGFPDDSASSQAFLVAERQDAKLRENDFAYVDQLVRRLDELRVQDEQRDRAHKLGIKQVLSYRTPVIGPRLIGSNPELPGQAVLTQVSLRGTYQAKETRLAVDSIQQVLAAMPRPPTGLQTAITGSAAVGHDMNQSAISSVNNTTYATIALVVIILLVVYQSPLLALTPLLTIALSVFVSLLAIALLTKIPGLNFRVINITNIFVIVVLFGAGTDYCLFLIARYREELARGRRSDDALSEAIRQVGGALVASAGTVICGLGMLWFSSFAKIQYTGPAIALSLAIGLVASLTLAPTFLHWLRGTVFWPFRPPHLERGADPEAESLKEIPLSKFWFGMGDAIARRPGLILLVSLVALTPFAILGARTQPSYSQLADLGPEQPSVIGAHIVQRYWPMGELSPAQVLIDHPQIDFLTKPGREAIAKVSRDLAVVRGVSEVRSVSQPLGKPLPLPSTPPEEASNSTKSAQNLLKRLQKKTFAGAFTDMGQQMVQSMEDAHYVSKKAPSPDRNHITRLTVVFSSDPFSPPSLDALERVRELMKRETAPGGPLAGTAAFGLAGSTALIRDLKLVTSSDERRMYVLVTLGVYVILVLLLRRPGICLYLIATVVLGYLASLGITELVFRSLHHGPEPWAGLDWKVGFFLFVILVAVGEDYNIFLMSRVIEEERKHGPVEGTRLAVAHTGGIISSCGLIMAGTFGSMLVADLTALRELGFALCLGVLLDTFLVRPILVPAFVILIHRRRAETPVERQPTPRDREETAASRR